MTQFFRYAGSKLKYANILNPLIDSSTATTYCEPFVGSGGTLFNLSKSFDHYIINDVDTNIIRIYRSFQNNRLTFKLYTQMLNYILDRFGCIKTNKESYYSFRTYVNDTYYQTDTFEEGIYMHMLANSCINSLLRFGPNGMNQGYGARNYILDNITLHHIKTILSKTEIYNTDYQQVLKNTDNTFFMLDPPYLASPSKSYKGFTSSDAQLFIDNLSNLTEYVYTDVLHEYNQTMLPKVLISKMKSIAPSNRNNNIKYEYAFYTNNLISAKIKF